MASRKEVEEAKDKKVMVFNGRGASWPMQFKEENEFDRFLESNGLTLEEVTISILPDEKA